MNELLSNINGKATQAAVEDVLRQYRTYMLTTPEEMMPAITAKYTLEMPNFSNVKQSSVENAAVKIADSETKYLRFLKWFNLGYFKLTTIERQIVFMAYLDADPLYNYEIYTELRMSESKYYRLRRRALFKLAIGLRIEVYESEE
ncbi:hypothetical protein SporoP37_15795 [Sporosarcina sp. P37]|uniref:ArpU family phage packaging/lysis transcriptional regulator n=1 Tax=unclassified Sporosarcina TaxID=2647733 RepID=UPI000A17F940|nr:MULTISPECIES: ArpU family phage packaging/lysis transcriptional regulator [unclassified Sporosarcina]ARK25989.1 hypothetical protein SporoP37_15795 [Sporosarcina sp. P37]PID19359.1 ArpU family transcriptional regulator [Sporosarcina sp. P35]